jgi:hypothetical protein
MKAAVLLKNKCSRKIEPHGTMDRIPEYKRHNSKNVDFELAPLLKTRDKYLLFAFIYFFYLNSK